VAIKYVWSGATGSNDGSSWANAWVSIASSVGIASTDEIAIADDHSELKTANTTWTWTNGTITAPIRIISTNRTSGLYSAGAIIGTDPSSFYTLNINGNIYFAGVDIRCSYVLSFGNNGSNPVYQTFDRCWIRTTKATSAAAPGFASGGGKAGRFELMGCTIDQSAQTSWQKIPVSYSSDVRIHGGTIIPPATVTQAFVQMIQQGGRLLATDLDLSAFGTLIEPGSGFDWQSIFRRNRLKSGYAAFSGSLDNTNQLVLIESCAVGAITVPPLGLTYQGELRGTVQSDLARYRTGGADDGSQANPHSWAMATNANAAPTYAPLRSQPIPVWVAGGASKTFTVYLAAGASLNDDEFWIELAGPDNTPTTYYARGYRADGRREIKGTPAALTTDGTSTWTGSGVGTKMKCSIAYTPSVAGPVQVRACLAKASTTVYLDPAVYVS
jgi:hypothetical protein